VAKAIDKVEDEIKQKEEEIKQVVLRIESASPDEKKALPDEMKALRDKEKALRDEKKALVDKERDEFGQNIKFYKLKTKLNIRLPFQNREREIEQMALTSLNNLKASNCTISEQSTTKLTLLTTAQMWGSGKSWLRNNFLIKFKSPEFQKFRQQLEKEFGEDNVATLCNSVYVNMDFREFSGEPYYSNLTKFVCRALLAHLLTHFPQNGDFWAKEPSSKWNPRTIVEWFSETHNTKFFLHFD